MSDITEQVGAQLRDELGAAVSRIAVLAGPEEFIEWEQTVAARAPMLAAQLCQDQDDNLAAETVIDVMNALWPHGSPEDRTPDWWRTPLGRMCARSLGRDDAEAVTHSVAAAMLGVTRGTVAQLVTRGTLDRHPEGGVLRSSVLLRIAHS